MTQRTSIFSDVTGVDVSGFQPKVLPGNGPAPDDIDRVSNPKFRSREPSVGKTEGQPSTKRKPMVYRTGRNTTFSVKTTKEVVDTFYEIAESQGWKAGETFEKAIELLNKAVR